MFKSRICFATKPVQQNMSAAAKKALLSSDKRYPLIRKMLYDNPPPPPPIFTPQQQEQHEIIERTWCLVRQRSEMLFKQNMKLRYQAMHNAVSALERVNHRLYLLATRSSNTEFKNGDLVYRFSGKLRVPTHTPPMIESTTTDTTTDTI